MRQYSIHTLLTRQNIIPRSRPQCLYLIHVSQLIKDVTGSGNNYTDSHYECSKTKQRLSTRHKCINCNIYKPIISDNETKNKFFR
jgi:hypothetical protein